MLGRSQPLRSLFRLYKVQQVDSNSILKVAFVQRGFASAGGAPPPGELEAEGSGGGVGRYLLAGLVVAATGAAVWYKRDLFHDYPVHPVILKPVETLQTLPATHELAPETVSPELNAFKADAASETLRTDAEIKPVQEKDKRDHIAKSEVSTEEERKGTRETVAEKKGRAEDPIPPEITDNTAIVELFSEALGQKLAEDKNVDVHEWLKGELDASVLSRKLLAAAIKDAVETHPDWTEFQARHRQAAYDASLFKCFVDKERKLSQAAIEELQDKIGLEERQIKELEASLSSMKAETKEKIKKALHRAEIKHEQSIKTLREKMEAEAAEKTLEERIQRLKDIDQALQPPPLYRPTAYWMEQTKTFTNAQQSALEATSMNKLLERRDFGLAWLGLLKEEDVKDPMLKAALQSLPHEKVPSKRELIKNLHRLRTSLEYYALLPPSGGGLLSQLTASIGAKLKFKASLNLDQSKGKVLYQVPEIYGDSTDITSRLDQVERALTDGSVAHAVSLLTDITNGSSAAQISEQWIHDAKQYAAVQAIQKILLARAQELTITVS